MGLPRGCSQPRLGAPGPSLCPGHPALGQLGPAEPKLQQSPCSLLPHLAQGEPKAPLPLPWRREGTRNLPEGPVTFQGFFQPPLFPTPSMVLGTKSHHPPLLLSWRSPCPGLCQPGLAAHSPLGACSGILWQPLPTAQGAARSQLCPPVPHCSCLFLAAPRAGMTQPAPCAVGWMNNL